MNLERAIKLAAETHEGHKDKGGAPYILHAIRVMLEMNDDESRMAAILHDTVEDGGVCFTDLHLAGFPDSVVRAVDALTHRDGETYEMYIERASKDPIAAVVKLADLRDNMNLDRIPWPTRRDVARLKKYQWAYAKLLRSRLRPTA